MKKGMGWPDKILKKECQAKTSHTLEAGMNWKTGEKLCKNKLAWACKH